MAVICPFTEDEARAANEAWGCNCGPAALAFVLQSQLSVIRYSIPNFEERRYTSPTMMRAALRHWRVEFMEIRAGLKAAGVNNANAVAAMFAGPMTLVRIQWTGPWIVDGKPQRWAGRQTHWIATWAERGVPLVFDVNGGIQGFGKWESEIVPLIVAQVNRADGGWFSANIWRLTGR
jgi:hypothetical protein